MWELLCLAVLVEAALWIVNAARVRIDVERRVIAPPRSRPRLQPQPQAVIMEFQGLRERPRPAPPPEPEIELEGVAVQAVGSRCGVCGEGIAERAVSCSLCDAPHHRECWDYNEGCATYACRSGVARAAR